MDRSQDIGGFNPLTFMFSDTFPISSYLKLLLIPFIFLSLIKISKNISFSKIYLGIINGFLLLVFPALFLSLSYKYSTSQMEHYTITVFQFFGTTLFFMCIFLWIDKKFINSYWVTILSRVIVLIFLLFTSLAHDYANNMYANDLKLSQSRFTFMDDFIKTDYYDKIGNKDIIYAPSLWNSVAYSEESKRLTEQGFNWGYFSNLIYNKDRNIIRDKEDLINKCNLINSKAYFYSFVLIQAYQTTDIMLVAAKINKNQYKKDSFFSDTVDVFIYSNNNKGIINYKTNLILSDSSSISKYNAIIIKKDDLNNKIWHKRIENKQIEIQSINISFMN
ncbi:MAG: hypothetical protein NTZ33_13220 [Bacteroidetes bacterium]|nr:hypothetical protein [Bacteroidota bacterium]